MEANKDYDDEELSFLYGFLKISLIYRVDLKIANRAKQGLGCMDTDMVTSLMNSQVPGVAIHDPRFVIHEYGASICDFPVPVSPSCGSRFPLFHPVLSPIRTIRISFLHSIDSWIV